MDKLTAAPYPADREADVVLRDGWTVRVRPIRADDEAAVSEFLHGLSQDSIGFRFFGVPNMNWVLAWSLDVDYADRFALVAETGAPARIIAHGSYIRINEERAEVAFLVADAWQGPDWRARRLSTPGSEWPPTGPRLRCPRCGDRRRLRR